MAYDEVYEFEKNKEEKGEEFAIGVQKARNAFWNYVLIEVLAIVATVINVIIIVNMDGNATIKHGILLVLLMITPILLGVTFYLKFRRDHGKYRREI